MSVNCKCPIDWLKDHTGDTLAFFGVEIDLWRIGASESAPKFNVVSSPNEWTGTLEPVIASEELTETKLLQLDALCV